MAFKKRWDWVPCENFGQSFTFPTLGTGISPMLHIGLCQNDARVEDQAQTRVGRPDSQSGFTVKAIRGSVEFGVNIPVDDGDPVSDYASMRVVERIHVGLLDFNDDSTIAVPVTNLYNSNDGNERFLWERSRQYDLSSFTGGGLNGTGGFTLPIGTADNVSKAWADVEVQSERRINQGEILLYTVQTLISTENPGTSWAAFLLGIHMRLRTLVRT